MSIPKISILPLSIEHAEARTEAIKNSISHLQPWLPWVSVDYSLADSVEYIENANKGRIKNKDYHFAIIEEAGAYAGEVKLLDVNREYYQRSASLAYWVKQSMIGRGIATEAVKQLARFAFHQLDLIRIEIFVNIDNQISQKIPKKVNASYEGKLRNKWFMNGEPQTVYMYSLIPTDLG